MTEYFQALYRYAIAHGLNADASYHYALLGWVGAHYALPALAISQGYRSPARTAYLQAQWDSGNRSGLLVRPASRSQHHTGDAFDVANTDTQLLLWYGSVVRYIPGMRWGGNFRQRDIIHFDLGGS